MTLKDLTDGLAARSEVTVCGVKLMTTSTDAALGVARNLEAILPLGDEALGAFVVNFDHTERTTTWLLALSSCLVEVEVIDNQDGGATTRCHVRPWDQVKAIRVEAQQAEDYTGLKLVLRGATLTIEYEDGSPMHITRTRTADLATVLSFAQGVIRGRSAA